MELSAHKCQPLLGEVGTAQPHCSQMLFEPVISKETSHLLPRGFSVMLVSACQTEFTVLPERTWMDLCQIQWQSLQTWVIPSAADTMEYNSMEKCKYFHAEILYDATSMGLRQELLDQFFFFLVIPGTTGVKFRFLTMALRPLVAQVLPTPLSLLSVPISPGRSKLLFVPLTGNSVPTSKPLHLLSSLLGILFSPSPHG